MEGLEMIKLFHDDCFNVFPKLEDNSIDLTVTSPPYDNLRTYNNSLVWNKEIWQNVIKELYRITKNGSVVVWVVGDATIKGSETGTSFRQALYALECGFKLHDTMIYQKLCYVPLTHRRYEQSWEYMFIFVKGELTTFNPIKIPCTYAGTKHFGKASYYKTADDELSNRNYLKPIADTKIKPNIWGYLTGSTQTGKIKHPAVFPLQLAKDHIESWSNEKDTVFDPFMGSGTTGVACKNLNRNFIGIEKEENYFEIARRRIDEE
jgi:DNA modification methylase